MGEQYQAKNSNYNTLLILLFYILHMLQNVSTYQQEFYSNLVPI